MLRVTIGRAEVISDRQGRTFADVLDDPRQPLDAVLAFFNDEMRQRRMEESEIHHDRPPLAGVVRELEAIPSVAAFLASNEPSRAKRLRQVVGVIVRMIMEQLGWKKTGKKGSLGVRTASSRTSKPRVRHNTGGLALWFLRAERYQCPDKPAYPSVRERSRTMASGAGRRKRQTRSTRTGNRPQANAGS